MKIRSDVKDELLDDYLVLHIFSFAGDTLDPMQKRTVKPSAFTIMPLFPLMFYRYFRSVELSILLEASAGRAAAQFIVRSKGVGGAATNKQKAGFR